MAYVKKNVLIVDDSNLIVQRLKEMLEELQTVDEILYAYNFSDAVSILTQTTPSIILLDINLPDTSGIELLRMVKQKYPTIMVTMVTNQSNSYYRDLCKKLGADYFVDKSTAFDIIPGIITSGIYK